MVSPAGNAAPGDLVRVASEGGVPEVVRAHSGGYYPGPGSEVARVPRARMAALSHRAWMTRQMREYFEAEGFLEVDAPLMVRAPALEVHLDAFEVGDRYLITSPEYQHKRLLAAGFERIYSVCRCFRRGETGAQHQPEFTMIEWYRAWAELEDILADTERLVAGAAECVRGRADVEVGGRLIDLSPPWPRMTVAEAMARWAGLEELRGDEEASALAAKCRDAGIDLGTAAAWDDVFYAAFVARVEPALALLDTPMVLTDWPVRLGALARKVADRPEVVERFEAYVGGIELCNAFGELTCPVEQRARFENDLRERARRCKATPPVDERLLEALAEGLPPSAGNALGLDRLLMLVTGADDIRQVIWFAADEL